jgi:hypothetical protein
MLTSEPEILQEQSELGNVQGQCWSTNPTGAKRTVYAEIRNDVISFIALILK